MTCRHTRRCAAAPPRFARGSDGPRRRFGTQRSPTFSKECLSAANAVRWARSPSPYSLTALSWAFAHVRCASFGERLIVSGISVRVGILVSSCPLLFSLPDSLVPVRGFRPKLLGELRRSTPTTMTSGRSGSVSNRCTVCMALSRRLRVMTTTEISPGANGSEPPHEPVTGRKRVTWEWIPGPYPYLSLSKENGADP